MSTEFLVNPEDSFKKVEYLIRKDLKEKGDLTVVSGIYSSYNATKVVENLEKHGYVTFGNITTSTKVVDGKRRITLAVKLNKTKDFDKKYEEYEANKQKYLEEKKKRTDGKEEKSTPKP